MPKAAATRIRELLRWTPELDNLDVIVRHALAWERHLMAQIELAQKELAYKETAQHKLAIRQAVSA